MFGLPDLQSAIADFLHREATYGNHIHSIGGPRRAVHGAELPFDKVQVWFKIHLQETEFHNPHNIQHAQTLNCAPPSDPWTLGRYNLVIIQTSSGHSWPASSLSGHSIAQIRLVIRPLGRSGTQWAWDNQHLTYVQQFDISSECDVGNNLATALQSIIPHASQYLHSQSEVIPKSREQFWIVAVSYAPSRVDAVAPHTGLQSASLCITVPVPHIVLPCPVHVHPTPLVHY
ncbi:hypothetical protein EDB19DRAFT_1917942 [Suillus lakei]|nr:hypothetical protein EDB19DRAFT_1917942 [Suillus lakei]